MRQRLKALAAGYEWQEALEVAETAMGTPAGRGWLDLQRYAVRACEELGYSAPAAAIKSELRALLADFPNLTSLTLMDDTPCANAETAAWLRENVTTAPAASDPYYSARAPEPEPAQEEDGEALGSQAVDPYQLAVEAARSGNAQEGIEILAREAAQERSGRARFQRKAQLAQICLASGHAAVALPILANMVEEIEHRKLEDWEAADMLAHPLALLFRCMQKVDVPQEEKKRIYDRICRLDPVQALDLVK